MTSNNKSVSEKSRTTPTYIGHVIGSTFGLVFVLVNSAPLPSAFRVGLCALAVAMFLVVVAGFITTLRTADREEDDSVVGFTARFWIIVGVEAVLLFGGLAIVRPIEPAAALGWIALVVGAHFFPLSRLWAPGRAQIMAIAIAMTSLGVAGLTVAFTTHNQDAVALLAGVGSGIVLLVAAFLVALGSLTRRSAVR
jgi:hypothetical protein